jgi:hypothetical protein
MGLRKKCQFCCEEKINVLDMYKETIIELKPCPFCSEKKIEIRTLFDGEFKGEHGWSAVCICSHCRARGPDIGGYRTKQEAENQVSIFWNNAPRIHWYHFILKNVAKTIRGIKEYLKEF